MILTCEKCGHKHPLSDDDVAFFHPRFFCVTCGTRIEIAVDESKLLTLQGQNDRDRRLPNMPKTKGDETVRHIRPGHTPPPSGTDGG